MAQAPPVGSTVTVNGPISGGIPEWTIGISGPCSATPPQGSPGSPCPAFLHAANMDIQRTLQRAQQAAPARVTITGTVTGVAPPEMGPLAGVPIISVTAVSGAPPGPEPFRVGSVVDITATVESIGPGGYRISTCLGGAPCPAVLQVPGAETQARLNAAQLNNVPAEIHGTISSFQAGGTPIISVSSVRVELPPPPPPPQMEPLPADPAQCVSACLANLRVEMSVSSLLGAACSVLARFNVPAAGVCAGVAGSVFTGELLSCLSRCRVPGFRIPAVLEQLVGRQLTATGGGSGGTAGSGSGSDPGFGWGKTFAGTVVPVPAAATAGMATHMVQTSVGALFLQPADSDSLAKLIVAARIGRPVTFTPVSLDGSRRVLLVKSVCLI